MSLAISIAVFIYIIGVWSEPDYRKNRLWLWGVLAKDIVNPVKWMSFVRGNINSLFLQPHILEQMLIRRIECVECIELGRCPNCGCPAEEKMADLNASCAAGKWGPVERNKELWEKRKKAYKVKINVSYGI